MARAPCWSYENEIPKFTVRTQFVPEPGCQKTSQIVEQNLRTWLRTNVASPYLRRGFFAFLRARIVTDIKINSISDEEIENTLIRIRDREWPYMAYEAGLIPVYYPQSGSVKGKTAAKYSLQVENRLFSVIPANGTISEMVGLAGDSNDRPETGSTTGNTRSSRRETFVERLWRKVKPSFRK